MSAMPLQAPPTGPAARTGPAPRQVERCLVVDDDLFDRMMLRRCLGRDRPDLHIVERASLSGARAYLARNKADLIVLDNRLPDGKGAEFAAELRRDATLRDTMICVVTGQDASGLDTVVPALSKDALDSGTLWSLVGEYLDLCDIATDSDEGLAVSGFGEAVQARLGPQLSRMLRSVRSARAAMGGTAPRVASVELERLESTILSLSDLMAEADPVGAVGEAGAVPVGPAAQSSQACGEGTAQAE